MIRSQDRDSGVTSVTNLYRPCDLFTTITNKSPTSHTSLVDHSLWPINFLNRNECTWPLTYFVSLQAGWPWPLTYLLPLQAWMTMTFGLPLSVSTSLRSPTRSSVSQAFFLFRSSRCPLSLPWQSITSTKQLLFSWFSSRSIHFLCFLICCVKKVRVVRNYHQHVSGHYQFIKLLISERALHIFLKSLISL